MRPRPVMSAGTPVRRRGMVLAAVLMVIALLAVIMTGFVFFVQTEATSTTAFVDVQQARLAQDSALDELSLIMRENTLRHDPAAWFNDPERFRHRLVWSPVFDRRDDPVAGFDDRERVFADEGRDVAWRYAIVAPWYDGDDETFRFGITPESGKLNLNVATEEQLRSVFTELLLALDVDATEELIDALLDWRDADDDVRENGAEAEWYGDLEPPYQPKNGLFDTVEELLLVKGFSAAILWGEDVNRNGLLDPNEDDGDESFPEYDNADGVLNLGIAPYLTVWSRETDVAFDNKPRINLRAGGTAVRAQLELWLEEGTLEDGALSEETIAFLTGLNEQAVAGMSSPADLYFDGSEAEEEEEEGFEDEEAEEEEQAEEQGQQNNNALTSSPILLEEMPIIMERFTLRDPQQAAQPIYGLININTAPRPVLRLVPGIDEEIADLLIASRRDEPEGLTTTAWPLTRELVDGATFRRMAPAITTKAYQQRIEVVAYADHTPLWRRAEYIVELAGPLMQIRYRRDLTPLGAAWPVDRDEEELLD